MSPYWYFLIVPAFVANVVYTISYARGTRRADRSPEWWILLVLYVAFGWIGLLALAIGFGTWQLLKRLWHGIEWLNARVLDVSWAWAVIMTNDFRNMSPERIEKIIRLFSEVQRTRWQRAQDRFWINWIKKRHNYKG